MYNSLTLSYKFYENQNYPKNGTECAKLGKKISWEKYSSVAYVSLFTQCIPFLIFNEKQVIIIYGTSYPFLEQKS